MLGAQFSWSLPRQGSKCDALEMTAGQLRREDLEFDETRQNEPSNVSRHLDSSLGVVRHHSDIGRCVGCGSLPRSASCAPVMTSEVNDHWNYAKGVAAVELPRGITVHIVLEGNINLAYLDFTKAE